MAPTPVTSPTRLVLIAFVLFAACALPASAGKPQSTLPLHLTAEQLLQPYYGPSWCLDEDDWHYRTWAGYLQGTFTTSENYCNEMYQGQWETGGGESIGLYFSATGRLDGISIAGRDEWGTYYERTQAVITNTYVIGNGRKQQVWNDYYACVSIRSPGYTGWPFAGPWTISISGDFADMYVREESAMFDYIEQNYCPPGQGP